jgi:AraC-like DNA-binding protein
MTAPQTKPEVKKLVEYRTAFWSADSELSFYTTNQPTKVQLQFPNPIICRMTSGKKWMSLAHLPTFTFLPGESLMVPAGVVMDIDFRDTSIDNATHCLCIEIDACKVNQIVRDLNERNPRSAELGEWEVPAPHFYRIDNPKDHVDPVINKLVKIFRFDNTEYRDLLIDLAIAELITRVLQSRSSALLAEDSGKYQTRSGLAAAIQYIKDNPCGTLTKKRLLSIACMSQSSFNRSFKRELGITPTEFINQVKIQRAREMLRDPRWSVTQVCYEIGFSNVSHFIKRFKSSVGITPKKYQQRVVRNASALTTSNLSERRRSAVVPRWGAVC